MPVGRGAGMDRAHPQRRLLGWCKLGKRARVQMSGYWSRGIFSKEGSRREGWKAGGRKAGSVSFDRQ